MGIPSQDEAWLPGPPVASWDILAPADPEALPTRSRAHGGRTGRQGLRPGCCLTLGLPSSTDLGFTTPLDL